MGFKSHPGLWMGFIHLNWWKAETPRGGGFQEVLVVLPYFTPQSCCQWYDFFFYTVYLLDQQRPATSNTKYLKIHPGRIAWNLKITQLKRKIIFQTIIFRFHVNLLGCISIVLPVVWLANLERFSIHAVTEEPLLYFGFGRILPWSLQDLQTALSKYGFHFDLGLNLKLPFRVNLRVRENRKRQWKVVAAWE